MHAIREALITVFKLDDFHIVQFSVQRTHIHLLVEADGRQALATGMQAFGISAAKHINALIRDAGRQAPARRGVPGPLSRADLEDADARSGTACAYVLNNWRHHGEDRGAAVAALEARSVLERDHVRGLEGARGAKAGRFVQPPTFVAPLVWAAVDVAVECRMAEVRPDQRVRSPGRRRRVTNPEASLGGLGSGAAVPEWCRRAARHFWIAAAAGLSVGHETGDDRDYDDVSRDLIAHTHTNRIHAAGEWMFRIGAAF